MKARNRLRRILLSAVLLTLCVCTVFSLCAFAVEPAQKTVRVGWFESPFNRTDEFGRRSGYGYEYQQELAAHTGWRYEYVNGSWSELLDMLKNGEIDLLSDVSYTPERAQQMLFSAMPMGAEEYYAFVSPDNREITATNLSSMNGKKVGVNKDSVQKDLFLEWEQKHGIQTELIELTCSEDESLSLLANGEIDVFVSLDFYGNDNSRNVPICKIGASDFFFAVTNSRADLLAELNTALDRIQSNDRYYNQRLFDKFFSSSGVNLYLDNKELAWLSLHSPIKVGYPENYLAFCAKDKKTGELVGALKDLLDIASNSIANAHLTFEPVAYPTVDAAMQALADGEVDCMFPSNLSKHDGEVAGVFMIPTLVETEVSAIVREADAEHFSDKQDVVVAVYEGNLNYEIFLKEHFLDWEIAYYTDTASCLKAIADGAADCMLVSDYRYNSVSTLCQRYNLVSLSTNVDMDYSFAVSADALPLYSILCKVSSIVPNAKTTGVLTHYYTEEATMSFLEILKEYSFYIMAFVALVLAGVIVLLTRGLRAEKAANERQKLIMATEHDSLTGLYNRSYFYEFMHRMHLEQPDVPMDAVMLNIERFHSVNSVFGHDFGDLTLKTLGSEIADFVAEKGGIASRFGADRFAVYCPHMENEYELYNRLQAKMDELSPYNTIRIRMGIAPTRENVLTVEQYEQAQIACGLAKGQINKYLVVYDDSLRQKEELGQRLLSDLKRAIENNEFIVCYQPKYNIQTEQPTFFSAEALVRWNHPEFGMMRPDVFVPILEQHGQIGLLDKHVWEKTAKQIAAWKQELGVVVPVSVNLSRVEMFDETLVQTLNDLIARYNLERNNLNLEVTESAYTENEESVIQVIERLREQGYRIEMDDFGSGYSSLNMLSAMPIDMLKMDGAFVRDIESNEKDRQLVELIIDIAKNLKVPVVAEGVETEAQLRLLKLLGCDYVQGYYFAKPMPSDEFRKVVLETA